MKTLKKNIICVILFLSVIIPISAEVDLDYNYEYEKDPIHTKFTDWIPFKLHKWEPKFLEDYYELYGLKQYYGEQEIRRNIYFLNIALGKRFRHPKNALCAIKDEKAYHKYRLLVFMHIHYLLMRANLRIGSLYDKRHLYFYNLDFAYDLKKSFSIARTHYENSKINWEKTKKYAKEANEIPIDLDLGTVESLRYNVITGKTDFDVFIGNHIQRVSGKISVVDDYLAKFPEANKPLL